MPPSRLNGRIMANTVHRILHSPELLEIIFTFLERDSLGPVARVCKLWSPIALDVLWREIEDLKVLLQLLAPIKTKDTIGGLMFERPPDPQGWLRFGTYAKRVRKLIYRTHGKPFIHKTAFDAVARTRTRVDILPNLHSLVWCEVDLDSALLFMHQGIKAFAITIGHTMSLDNLSPFFDEIIFRMPDITTLDIRSTLSVSDYEDHLARLIRSLPKLEKIVLPRFYVTTRLAEVMSQLEHLGVLEFQYHDTQGAGNPQDVAVFNPSFSEGAFPTLWDVSISVSFENAISFLSGPFTPANITMLHLDSDQTESAACIRQLTTLVADSCQNISYLGLASFQERAIDPNDSFQAADYVITLDTLRPLLKLANLTRLEIKHQYPLTLTQADLETIASHWPLLETLVLNDEPTELHTATLTLEALLPFARHCPNLSHLGIFLDANAYCPSLDPESSTYDSTNVSVFQSLQLLTVGVSPVDQDERPTLYLSQMLPLQCQIESGVTWDSSVATPPDASLIVKGRCDMWDSVSKLLPMMIKLRAEERSRTRAMERELVELKTRTGVIRDLASS